MKKLGTGGLQWLKIFHIVFITLMLGGILSSLALRFQLQLASFDEVNVTYKSLKTISDHIIRYGAQGIIITGLIYSIWTNWGFIKYKWIAVKWIVFFTQTLFGIFFIDRWMVENITMLEIQKSMALSNSAFIHNQSLIQFGAIAQSTLIICLICISVLKPWKNKK
jgi:hypothetical protein